MANEIKWLGIDVSAHQGNIDWSNVKKNSPEIKFAIIKATEGTTYVSNTFHSFYNGCKANGIYVGAYHYLKTIDVATARLEAKHFISTLKGKQFEMPVYLDIEETAHVSAGKKRCIELVNAFCGELEKAGYFVGVYSMDSFFISNLDKSIQQKYTCWPANVSSQPKYAQQYDMWQYSWKGNVSGVPTKGNLDMNYCYKDFPSIIKSKGMNGFAASSSAPPSTNQLVEKMHNLGYIQDKIKWNNIVTGKTTAKTSDILDLFSKIV